MAFPLALPLAPVAGAGASAAAATFIAGSSLKLAETVYGFRRPVPTLPPVTGLEGQTTLQAMIVDALKGARVPVASLPNPLGPNGSVTGALAVAAALALWPQAEKLKNYLSGLNQLQRQDKGANKAQNWGYLGGPKLGGRDGPVATYSGTWDYNGLNIIGFAGYWVGTNYLGEPIRTNGASGQQTGISGLPVVTIKTGNTLNAASLCLGSASNSCGYYPPGGALHGNYHNWTGFMGSFTFSPQTLGAGTLVTGNAVTGNPVNTPVPWVGAPIIGENDFAPATLPQVITPLPQATTQPSAIIPNVPAESNNSVVPIQPGPQRPAVPSISSPRPATIPPWLLPGGNPTTEQITNDGKTAPVLPAPVLTTDPDSIIPWPGAAPIPGTGPAPASTLQGIAQEVGRIERKLEIIMNPTAPGNLLDKFADLSNFIAPLIEAIMAATSGTTYTLDSPCEIDEDGNRLPAIEVPAPGALTSFGAILNRVDALAELLQVHKDLKQPNCKQKPPTGEFVTVNFEQID